MQAPATGECWLVVTESAALVVPILTAAVQDMQGSIVLPPAGMSSERAEELAQIIGASRCVYLDDQGHIDSRPTLTHQRFTGPAGLGIHSSGTTGVPKLRWHDWRKVSAAARRIPEALAGKRWMSGYSVFSFAGVQVMLSAIYSDGYVVHTPESVRDIAVTMVDESVEIVSATPTWWRRAMLGWPPSHRKPALTQATIGGEQVDQSILDAIRDFFHTKRITHVYASSEVGTAIAVSDGLAGIPEAQLSSDGRTSLRIREGYLEVRSTVAALSLDAHADADQGPGWIRTQDLAEIRGARLYITGRSDGVINIGGSKVSPERIEQQIAAIDYIADVRVYARSNAITGQVLCADVVLTPGAGVAQRDIYQLLQSRLDATECPRLIRIVDEIPLSPSGKKRRE